MSQLALGALGGIQLAPDVLDEQRGAWCSPVEYTKAAGPFGVDPFTNPRSTLVARFACMLERGDDGFGLDRRSEPGAFYVNPAQCAECCGTGCVVNPLPCSPLVMAGDLVDCTACGYHVATSETRVWIQPDYGFVLEAIAHYGHARFTALLRLDTSTEWFERLFALCEVVMIPKRDRIEFVPPPGVKGSANPFPHGIYYAKADDVTDAIASLCYAWPTPRYPAHDPLQLRSAV